MCFTLSYFVAVMREFKVDPTSVDIELISKQRTTSCNQIQHRELYSRIKLTETLQNIQYAILTRR